MSRFLKKLKKELQYDPAIPLPDMCLDKNMAQKGACVPAVHRSAAHNSQTMEATEMSTDGWMAKEDVAHTYNEVFSSAQSSRSVMTESTTPRTVARQASLSIASSQS